MPARNLYHDAVVAALVADGWTITDDPLGATVGRRRVFVDLGAEGSAVAAERAGRRIAVEIQTFANPSPIDDLHHAVGQYVVYRAVLRRRQPERTLYLAVSGPVYNGFLSEPLAQWAIEDAAIKLLVFQPRLRRVVRWID